eukprot:365420-Chlamydomonas_euryale.AAC.9
MMRRLHRRQHRMYAWRDRSAQVARQACRVACIGRQDVHADSPARSTLRLYPCMQGQKLAMPICTCFLWGSLRLAAAPRSRLYASECRPGDASQNPASLHDASPVLEAAPRLTRPVTLGRCLRGARQAPKQYKISKRVKGPVSSKIQHSAASKALQAKCVAGT